MMNGKTVVITGASSGIGRAAAIALSKLGADVAVVGRNTERTNAVAAQVGGRAFVADYDRLDEVRGLASSLLDHYPRVDVLANNAGGVISKKMITKDGFERTIQSNHLAPFLLTSLLLPRLRESRARVIGTSSVAHHFASIHLDDLNRGFEPYFGGWRSYGASKLATILFMRELTRRAGDDGVAAYSFHPGYVGTGFGDRSRLVALSRVGGDGTLGLSPESGAAPLVYLASAVKVDAPSGSYFNRLEPNVGLSRRAQETALDRALWDRSNEVLGLGWKPR